MIVFKYLTQTGQTEYFGFDATLQETTSLESDVTEHPVERGLNVTDHVREKPVKIVIDVLQTDFPLQNTGDTAAYADNSNGNNGVSVGNEAATTDKQSFDLSNKQGAQRRHIQAVQKLDGLRIAGTLIEVLTKYGPYKNMLIQHIELPRDSKYLDAAPMKITLKQIRTVELTTVLAERPKPVQAKKKKDTGAKTGGDVVVAQDTRVEALRSKLKNKKEPLNFTKVQS